MIGAALTGTGCALRPPSTTPFDSSPITFSFDEKPWPLLTVGKSISVSERIRELDLFTPFFDPRRPEVNPCVPSVRSNRLVFSDPGEYYLRVNRRAHLKVVVFEPNVLMLPGVLRLFNFMVANSIYFAGDDALYERSRRTYIENFFTSADPMMLTCSPTHQVFRRLVQDRFGLLTRVCSGPGTFWLGEQITVLGHNVPEVYIPELKKFIFVDVNNGIIPKWLDGIEIAAAVGTLPGTAPHSGELLSDINVDFHFGPTTCHASAKGNQLLVELGQEGVIDPTWGIVSDDPLTSESRMRALRSWYSGAMYWGMRATNIHPCGTEFLDGWAQIGVQEKEPLLACETRNAVLRTPYVQKLDEVHPDILRCRLENGHAKAIATKPWRVAFPS